MATTRGKKSAKGIKELPAKKLAGKQAKRVKGGYIGDTEKRFASINWGDGQGKIQGN